MTLPTEAELPYAKTATAPLTLTHAVVALKNTQARLAGRLALLPDVSLEDYRFRAVTDWLQFRMHLGRPTQARYVQDVLRQFLTRDSRIVPLDIGPGDVFSLCTIKVQEPASFARMVEIHQRLVDTFGEASTSQVTGVEFSIDAYPHAPSNTARALLLGAMQRTIWTDRDILSKPNSRPRTIFGDEKAVFKLSPPTDQEAARGRFSRGKERLNRIVPHHHDSPFLDGTMVVGAVEDDVMIRVMDKIIDEQNPKKAAKTLTADEQRVRIEVTLKEGELKDLGVHDLYSLATLKLVALQKRYFQFRLPTFSWRDNPQTGSDVLNNTQEEWRAETYLRSGVTGMVAMETARAEHMAVARKGAKDVLTAMGKQMTPTSRRAANFVSYKALNRKVTDALSGLARREASAWKRLS